MDRMSYGHGGSGVVHGDNKQSTLSITGNLPSTSSWFLEQGEEVIWISSRTVLAAQWSRTGTISSLPVLTAQIFPLHRRGFWNKEKRLYGPEVKPSCGSGVVYGYIK